jgi:hypothetical protein
MAPEISGGKMLRVKREGNNLLIWLPIKPKGKPSKSGKSDVIGTSGGPVATGVFVNKRCVWVVANAFLYPKRDEAQERAAVEMHRMLGRIARTESQAEEEDI